MDSNDAAGAEAGPDLRQYFNVIRTYWRGIGAILLITILLAFLWTLTQPKIYQASSSGLVVTAGADSLNTALAGETLAKSKAASYQSIAKSRSVAAKVKKELGLAESPDDLLEQISVDVPAETSEIRISAKSGAPEATRDLANSWVEALAAEITSIEPAAESDEGAGEAPIKLAPLGRAALPTAPVSPNTKLALALGGVVGLALGLGYALLRGHLDRRIRSSEAVEQLGLNVAGTIPQDRRLTEKRMIVETGVVDHGDRESHAFSESLRELRTNLSYMDVDNPPRTIVVTSSVPGEGKSSIAANLAVAVAATGREVVIIDGDLRRPVVTEVFGLPDGAGLTDVLSGMADLEDVLQPYGPIPNLSVLAAGRIPPNPSELLGSRSMKNLLRDLARDRVVIIDAPPLLPVTDAAILTKSADGALVTVKAGSTTVDELQKAIDNLRKVEGRVLGAILNQVPTKGAQAGQYGYYGYYGKYYYSSAEDGKNNRRKASPTPTQPPMEPVESGRAQPSRAPRATREVVSDASAPDNGTAEDQTSLIPKFLDDDYDVVNSEPAQRDPNLAFEELVAPRTEKRQARRRL
ncbi:polysaccharide biosynthesis tyrosine autokinase [Arthrobacter sp. AOP36-C1-22]|uniref:polysaccharide biosynthesis tyrosine autokinase n=1 Tax=Arthrobacter sp. AOP36-C1-22 TaxID=3457683 RepID=UPI004034A685